MDLKNVSKYIAGLGTVFMTVLILLIVVSVVQILAMEAIGMFAYTRRSTMEKSEPQRTDEEKRIERISRSSKEFLPDGTIHLVYEPRTEQGRIIEPRTEQIYDANDHLLWEGAGDQRAYEYLSWAEEPRYYYEALMLLQIKHLQMLTPVFSRSIEVPVGSINNTEQIWRYHPGAGCFEGYNIVGERIGYIGAAGFSDSVSKVKPLGECRLLTAWCPQDSSSPTLLWQTDRRVYQINFEKRQTELLFESADSDIERISLHAWTDLKPGAKGHIETEKYRPLLVCITENGTHHLILREPDQRLSLPGPYCSITATRQGIFIMRPGTDAARALPPGASAQLQAEWIEQYYNKPQKRWVEVYKVSDDGKLELLKRYDWTIPAPRRPAQMDPLMAARRSVNHFSPPLYALVFRMAGRDFWLNLDRSAKRGNFLSNMLQAPQWLQPLNSTVSLVLSVLMMGFVFWHGLPRRTSNVQFAFWLVFVGLLNLTGLLTYLALNYTTIVKCPACGRRRGLAQPDCVRCRAPLPAPKPRELDLILRNQ